MNNDKPTINIFDDEFHFDIENLALVDKTDAYNKIYFHEMEDHSTHYVLNYVPMQKPDPSIPPRHLDDILSDLFQGIETENKVLPRRIEIPRMGELDPEGMSNKYGLPISEIAAKTDFEIIVPQNVYNDRLQGDLITIDFPGKSYFVDVVNNMLRPVDEQGPEVNLDSFSYDYYIEDEEVYYLYYNMKEKEVVDILYNRDAEKDCIVVRVPHPTYLDPIGTNIAYARDPSYGLMYFDLKKKYSAEITSYPSNTKDHQVENNIEMGTKLFDLRTKEGFLPRIYIEGHTFFVDLQKGTLRPKDNFESKGIIFKEIRDYYSDKTNTYSIPYDPVKKEFIDVDLNRSSENPPNVKVISFADERKLDPVGWNKINGYNIRSNLPTEGITLHFQARAGKWEDVRQLQKIKNDPTRENVQKRGRRPRI